MQDSRLDRPRRCPTLLSRRNRGRLPPYLYAHRHRRGVWFPSTAKGRKMNIEVKAVAHCRVIRAGDIAAALALGQPLITAELGPGVKVEDVAKQELEQQERMDRENN